MSLLSYACAGLLIVSAFIYYLAPRRFQNAVLLLASVTFYFWALPRYGVYYVASVVLSYLLMMASAKLKGDKARKALLIAALAIDIGLLVFLKYSSFFAGLLEDAGVFANSPALSLAVPAGISFYTLQLAGYCVDVYRGRCEAERDFVRFALFAGFFPQLLSGPVGRANELIPQYASPREPLAENMIRGAERMLTGLFKKAVVADGLAAYVDAAYVNIGYQGTLSILIMAVIYSFQIYFDFSGYTNLAVGFARIYGIKLRENFDAPYLSASIAEFWNRWHMSLSEWFRDYIYFPLGGSRRGKARTAANLLMVFLISGLWHGAGATFLLWGLWHGVFRCLELFFSKSKGTELGGARRVLAVSRTFVTVTFGWILFRADRPSYIPAVARGLLRPLPVSQTVDWIYSVMADGAASASPYNRLCLALLAAAALLCVAFDLITAARPREDEGRHNPLLCLSPPLRVVCVVFMILCILLAGKFGSPSFIYYRF